MNYLVGRSVQIDLSPVNIHHTLYTLAIEHIPITCWIAVCMVAHGRYLSPIYGGDKRIPERCVIVTHLSDDKFLCEKVGLGSHTCNICILSLYEQCAAGNI